MGEEYAAEVLNRQSVFEDESKLDLDYTPDNLPHREEDLKQLLWMFKPLIQRPGSSAPVALLYSFSGTGKTSLAKVLGKLLVRQASKKGVNMRCVHVNCKFVYSMSALVDQVALKAVDGFSVRGAGPDQVFRAMYHRLEEQNRYLLLILDEVDWFINRTGEDVIQQLHRFREELEAPKRLAVLFITRIENIGTMPPLERSVIDRTFAANILELNPYKGDELNDILTQRVELAFKDGVVDGEVIEFIADQSKCYGDAYYAIELLWKAGRYADSQVDMKVTPEHVRMAKASSDPNVRRDDLNSLTTDEKLLLLGISQVSKDRTYISQKEATREFLSCCEIYRRRPVSSEEIIDHLHVLERVGFIHLDGPTEETTRVSIPDIPVTILGENLRQVVARAVRDEDTTQEG